MIVLLGLLIVATLVVVFFVRKQLKAKREYALLSSRVHEEHDKYSFLVDRKFHVKETNFYELNKNIKDDQPYVLGNVLRCQNACESGLCGTGITCKECPIRLVIKNSFKLQRNFNDLAATMHLYDANHEEQQVDVKVDGELVFVGNEPHFIVSVSNGD